ncbi:MAG TPA: 23S rRNA (guanosine(2251)-2'-O)-methyltransferase RlmB, partial [Blastocatellia bacterium]|nr:23S rRNA (guanosine(2251)-2'-O)-methyltransferase RlmB [Blastocatellia bacterium]
MRIIYGLLPVLEAVKAGSRRIERILIADGARHDRLRELLEASRLSNIPVRREPRAMLDRLTGRANHQGVVAIATASVYADEVALLNSINPDTLFILLDGIEDPHNLGAIIRTAECAGATAIFIPERRAAHLSETVVKTSAGATEHFPVARVTNIAALIDDLKKKNVWVVGVEQSARIVYTEYDYSGPTALVFGGEGHGLHRLVRERCDTLVSIPMRG